MAFNRASRCLDFPVSLLLLLLFFSLLFWRAHAHEKLSIEFRMWVCLCARGWSTYNGGECMERKIHSGTIVSEERNNTQKWKIRKILKTPTLAHTHKGSQIDFFCIALSAPIECATHTHVHIHHKANSNEVNERKRNHRIYLVKTLLKINSHAWLYTITYAARHSFFPNFLKTLEKWKSRKSATATHEHWKSTLTTATMEKETNRIE